MRFLFSFILLLILLAGGAVFAYRSGMIGGSAETHAEVEVSPGFLKTNTRIPLDHLVRIGQDVLVVADRAVATRVPVPVAG